MAGEGVSVGWAALDSCLLFGAVTGRISRCACGPCRVDFKKLSNSPSKPFVLATIFMKCWQNLSIDYSFTIGISLDLHNLYQKLYKNNFCHFYNF